MKKGLWRRRLASGFSTFCALQRRRLDAGATKTLTPPS